MSILAQLKAWRLRWKIDPPEDEILNRSVAVAFSSGSGQMVLDYLIETYYRPLQFVGPSDGGRALERNGQQLLIVDLLERYDKGMHPAAFEPERSSDDGKEWDVRL